MSNHAGHGISVPSLKRRNFLSQLARASIWAAASTLTIETFFAGAMAATQTEWRMCTKCKMIFFHGYNRSICPAGGRHAESDAENYALPYDISENAHRQAAWRFCNKCQSLFFDGYPNKGVCPARGGHQAQGFMFVLSHDVRATSFQKPLWRYCNKCHALFYDGQPNKGRCPAGRGHEAQGFLFVLTYRGHSLAGDSEGVPVEE